MPSFLRSIFKTSRGRGPQEVSRSSSPVETSPDTYTNDHLRDLGAIAEMLDKRFSRGRHQADEHGGLAALLRRFRSRESGDPQYDATMRQFLHALERVEDDRRAGRVSPFDSKRPDSSISRLPRIPSSREKVSMLGMALQVCEVAIARGEQMLGSRLGRGAAADLLQRCVDILEAQREEIMDLLPYAAKVRSVNIHALMQKYVQIRAGLDQIRDLRDQDAISLLLEMSQELEEGPDYLIDVAIIEVIIWHGELIDSGLGAEMRGHLQGALADRATEPSLFRYVAQSIARLVDEVRADVLDDEMAKDARNVIHKLLNQVRRRTAESEPASRMLSPRASISGDTPTASEASDDATALKRLLKADSGPGPISTPAAMAAPSPAPSRGSTPSVNGDFQRLGIDDLQKRVGSGRCSLPPMGTPGGSGAVTPDVARRAPSSQSSHQPAASAALPAKHEMPSTPSSEKSIFEFEGNLLTLSALDLVLAHRRLAMADSSGQYVGEVSWDDLRSAWIPKWAEKLQKQEIMDGEVPSTNPADFKVKKKDAWGNKIGWWEGKMFYEEEPKFE